MSCVCGCDLKEVDKTGFFFLFVMVSGCHGDYGCHYPGTMSDMGLETSITGQDRSHTHLFIAGGGLSFREAIFVVFVLDLSCLE